MGGATAPKGVWQWGQQLTKSCKSKPVNISLHLLNHKRHSGNFRKHLQENIVFNREI